ncbi:MAG TPA: stress response translation initiation inhibitor YciH [Planctomycetota bacterium]|nr:stress response translation initiation inhibitor YciH [Planctomycetota bacterium]
MEARRRMHVDRGQPLQPGRPAPPPAHGRPRTPGHPADGWVRVSRETKGRGGKGVTLISGLRLAPAQLEELCSELKRRCGAGGSVKTGVIELQGDQREVALAELLARGFKAKLAGG